MLRNYLATRSPRGDCAVTVGAGERRNDLPPRLDLSNHSPTGFEWGYGGSGPAQLALAILADALGNDGRALRLHQRFKFKVIASMPRDGFVLSLDQVLEHVHQIEAETGLN